MALRIIWRYMAEKKSAQDSATGCVAVCVGSWQYIECEHENHWIRVYVACKNTTQMMSNLSRLLEDSHSHAPMTTIILLILLFFLYFFVIILFFWSFGFVFFSIFCHFQETLSFLSFFFWGNFVVLVIPCLFFFLHFFCHSPIFVKPCGCDNSIQTSSNKKFLHCWSPAPRRVCRTCPLANSSEIEERTGFVPVTCGQDCGEDHQRCMMVRPGGWPRKGCTQNTTGVPIQSDPIRSQSWNLLRMKGGQGGVRNRKNIVLPAEWSILFFVMMIHDGNPY